MLAVFALAVFAVYSVGGHGLGLGLFLITAHLVVREVGLEGSLKQVARVITKLSSSALSRKRSQDVRT